MPKFVKPWYRASRKTWYVNLGGKQIKLGPDRAAAFEFYAKLIKSPVVRSETQRAGQTLVAVLDAFLQWLKPRRAPDTFEW